MKSFAFRFFAIALILCLLPFSALCQGKEHDYEYIYDETTPRYAFYFNSKLKMDPDAFPSQDQDIITGIADAINTMSVNGMWDSYGPSFMTTVDLVFNEKAGINFNVYGEDSHWSIRSNLLGDDMSLLIDYNALIEFSLKAYSRLDLPLQYLALALPNNNLRQAVDWTRAAWYYVMERDKQTHVTSKWYLLQLSDFLSSYYKTDNNFLNYVEAIAGQACLDEPLLEALSRTSEWFEKVIPEEGILVEFEGNHEKHTMGDLVVFDRVKDENGEVWSVRLPADLNGNILSIDYKNTRSQYMVDAKVYNSNQELILFADISADGIPATLPSAFDLNGHFRIGGTLLEENGLTVDIAYTGVCDGSDFTLSLVRPSDGKPMITAYGSMVPRTPSCPEFGPASAQGFNILSVNDRSLFTFINSIMKPFVKTALPVMEELPISTYQSIYTLLERYGILDLLMSGM